VGLKLLDAFVLVPHETIKESRMISAHDVEVIL
jgi:hypothetical protein